MRQIFKANLAHKADEALLTESLLFDLAAADEPLVEALRLGDAKNAEAIYLESRDLWSQATSHLFSGRYYLDTNPDIKSHGINPLIHYIRNGFFEGRSPHPVVDVKYILQQMADEETLADPALFQTFATAVLAEHGDITTLLRSNSECDPNVFFSNATYLALNEVPPDVKVPLLHYMQAGGRRAGGGYLQCSSHADLEYYMQCNPDLIAASVVPLVHLLEYGIQEGRKFNRVADLAHPEFLANTASLYRDPSLSRLPNFLARSKRTHQVASPAWETPFASKSLPSLEHQAPMSARSCSIGVVLYNNSAEELTRLDRSIARECAEYTDYRIDVRYLANDRARLSMYYDIVGDRVRLSESGSNEGFGRAHNALMRNAFLNTDFYIGANPDGYFLPGCVRSLIDFNAFHEGSALIEAAALPIDHPKWHDPVLLDTEWVSGACFGYSRRLWEVVGGFDERIHLYCEDVDLSWRVRLAGGQLKVLPSARFMHDVTPRFIEAPVDSLVRRGHMLQGAYYLAAKWGQPERASSLLRELEAMDLECLRVIQEPVDRVDPIIASRVADFSQSRFAPSRFWKD